MEEVIKNNEEINKLIQTIIKQRKSNNEIMEKDGEVDGEVKKILDEHVELIFQYELEKCIKIYELEINELVGVEDDKLKYYCQGKKEVTLNDPINGKADCSGGIDGLGMTQGMQEFINNVIVSSMTKLGYAINEGEPYFDYDSNKNIYHDSKNLEYTPEYNYVGSKKDQMDYFAKLFATNPLDMAWVIDAIAHEAMHTFGTSASTAFMKEGFTEELTREICQKYKIHMTPTSHTQEAEFVRKLEMVAGRDNVIKAAMWGQEFKIENFKEILKNYPNTTYDELSYIFKLLSYDNDKLNKSEIEYLDKLKNNNPEIIDILEEKKKLYDEQNETARYAVVSEKFEKELGLKEGTFYKYIDVLDKFYSLTSKYNKVPKFYRDAYKLSVDELKNEYKLYNNEKSAEDNKPNSGENILIAINSLFEQIRSDNPEKFKDKITSFEDLMKPINEYIKDKQLDIGENIELKDYSSVLEIQNKEINYLKNRILERKKTNKLILEAIELSKDSVTMSEIEEEGNILEENIRSMDDKSKVNNNNSYNNDVPENI